MMETEPLSLLIYCFFVVACCYFLYRGMAHISRKPYQLKSRSLLLLGTCALVAFSCAIPVLPTGGPQDKEPPVIVESNPVAESVNVSTDAVRIVFSEFVDQASFAQSISVSPAFDRPLQYKWRKNRVDITFPEELRENTTYILTIDTSLRDVNRVALTEPITLAFATGPEINRGKIAGRVIEPLQGKGIASFDVFAYALPDSTLPDSLPPSPAYRTQTDPEGGFAFDYMSEQLYFVIALQDRNRNRTPDGLEAFAVPPVPVILADSTNTDATSSWLVTETDTIPPQIQRIRSISNERFMLRLSESIQLLNRDPARWVLRDSVSNESYTIEDIYLYPEDPKQIYLKTPQLFATTHLLTPAGIADSSGNPVVTEELTFKPSANGDTLQLRFLGFYPQGLRNNEIGASVLSPTEMAGVRFNQPVTAELLQSFVTIKDTSEQSFTFDVNSSDGSVFYLAPSSEFPQGAPFTVSVAGAQVGMPDTTYTKQFQQLTEEDLGELSGIVVSEDSVGQIIIELFPSKEPLPDKAITNQVPDAAGTFVFPNLPDKGQYNFRAFLDKNGNSVWDGGQLIPYLKAEPLGWYSDSLQVRARWEQTLSDTLRIKQQ
ncbi:MAG: Ig-like domain-containing protein [Rhodothermales bacterium]